jgi:hypothetical protein
MKSNAFQSNDLRSLPLKTTIAVLKWDAQMVIHGQQNLAKRT